VQLEFQVRASGVVSRFAQPPVFVGLPVPPERRRFDAVVDRVAEFIYQGEPGGVRDAERVDAFAREAVREAGLAPRREGLLGGMPPAAPAFGVVGLPEVSGARGVALVSGRAQAHGWPADLHRWTVAGSGDLRRFYVVVELDAVVGGGDGAWGVSVEVGRVWGVPGVGGGLPLRLVVVGGDGERAAEFVDEVAGYLGADGPYRMVTAVFYAGDPYVGLGVDVGDGDELGVVSELRAGDVRVRRVADVAGRSHGFDLSGRG
jgi:hypothetical protein